MTARLWTHRNREPDSMFPHALMFGDRILRAFRSEDRSPNNYAEFCAIEAQLAPFVDLPDGVELRPTATGAWLREHGEGWRRLDRLVWSTDHQYAIPERTYVIRRVPEPPAPKTEKVPLHKVIGRELAANGRSVVNYTPTHPFTGELQGGPYLVTGSGIASGLVDDDGMVEVLKD